MCTKLPNEPLLVYAFRQFCEKPHAVMAFIVMVAAAYIYFDIRNIFLRLVDKVDGMETQLVEMNVRIANIERLNNHDNH